MLVVCVLQLFDAGVEELLQKKKNIFCVIGKQAASMRQNLTYAIVINCYFSLYKPVAHGTG